LRGTEKGGIPWMTILDGSGKELVNADGPQGNVGCPVAPHEREWFMQMIRTSSVHLAGSEIDAIETALAAYAKTLGG